MKFTPVRSDLNRKPDLAYLCHVLLDFGESRNGLPMQHLSDDAEHAVGKLFQAQAGCSGWLLRNNIAMSVNMVCQAIPVYYDGQGTHLPRRRSMHIMPMRGVPPTHHSAVGLCRSPMVAMSPVWRCATSAPAAYPSA